MRTRAGALPPRMRRFGNAHALLPVDPASGGTWISVNDGGIVFTLLNYNRREPRMVEATSAPTISRGRIIPGLLHCQTVSDATEAALQVRPRSFQPFRLIVLDMHAYALIESDGRTLRTSRRPFDGRPLLFTSSGLGDEVVEPSRRALFERMLADDPSPEIQDAFHQHTWPDARHLSIWMDRPEARTVSRTTIELTDRFARMRYVPVEPDGGRAATALELDLRIPQPS
jgi:hypothetical protein